MITIIVGRRELGKSTLARYLASSRQKQVIFDPRAQWDADDTRAEILDPVQAINDDEIRELLDVPDSAGRFVPIIVQPMELQGSANDLALSLSGWINDRRMDPALSLAVVLDEAGLYDLKAWDWIFRCSPRARVSIILTAHRPADISTTIRALADTWCLFRATQQHDIDVIADRCGDDIAERITTLDPYQFVSWDDAAGKSREHLRPELWKEPRGVPLDGAPLSQVKSVSARKLWET